MSNHYDIIIISAGSGGGTMTYKLAPSGKRILIFYRGGFIPKEKQDWDAHEVVLLAAIVVNENFGDTIASCTNTCIK